MAGTHSSWHRGDSTAGLWVSTVTSSLRHREPHQARCCLRSSVPFAKELCRSFPSALCSKHKVLELALPPGVALHTVGLK